ncbi:glycosyltransferase family 4 protein [Oleisolibacter albus]|uniref:glycosyltransferase family 4 protein n=1 Tax=Oleisolibacter albus TaxID=2171757 RepID=UPI000DF3072E|nr:glycosyltransferase family 4 protein [Oleisolibacter albus]
MTLFARTAPTERVVAATEPDVPGQTAAAARPHLLFLVTEDWYFCSHRLPVARAARDAGFAVSVATRVGVHGAWIEAEGFRLIPLDWSRASRSPWRLAAELWRIARLYRRERPDLVHHVAIKPAVLGALAAMLAGRPAVLTTLAGRGAALSGTGLPARLAGAGLRGLLRWLAARRRAMVAVQNAKDGDWLAAGPGVPRICLIPGSGVDLQHYRPLAEPSGPVTVAQVSRMLTLKGVEDLVEAVRRLRADGLDLHLLLAGPPDPTNPAGIAPTRLRAWSAEPGIGWLGPVEDVRTVWARAHIAVLASRGGEGVPKSLLEAAACGRAIVATDVAGIRDVARSGVNALLAPPGDPAALAAALRSVATDAALRRSLAQESRAVVCAAFGEAEVAARTLELYHQLLDTTGSTAGADRAVRRRPPRRTEAQRSGGI